MKEQVWAPPLVWGSWTEVGQFVFGQQNGFRKVTFETISNAPSTFDVEIEYCIGHYTNTKNEVMKVVAPATYDVPWGACGGYLKVRLRSHSIGQIVIVDTR